MVLPNNFLHLVLAWSVLAAASPTPSTPPRGLMVPLSQRNHRRADMTDDEMGSWLQEEGMKLYTKYGAAGGQSMTLRPRESGSIDTVNTNRDGSYYGTVGIGTPPTLLNVILDTGSSDLWIASSSCSLTQGSGCSGVPLFQSGTSSTFANSTIPFKINYGSGAASGNLARDTVLMAGFEVEQQTFAICNQVSSGLLQSPVSGLMGLAFQTISSSGAPPFWQSLVESNSWDQPLMAFFLTRFINSTTAQSAQQPGGSFTMGALDQTLYEGEVEYTDIPEGQESYWLIQLTEVAVNGNSIQNGLSASNNANAAAIDTGTTLVLGPSNAIAAIFAEIPGSAPATGSYKGYWTYPCDTAVTVSLSFGGQSWPISQADFQLAKLSNVANTCIGAFYEGNLGGTAPSWIIGDTFLKNVYSVFRYNPPSVGFAALSAAAMAESVPGPLPSPALQAADATITASTGSGSSSGSSYGPNTASSSSPNSGVRVRSTPIWSVLGSVLAVAALFGLLV